MFILELEVSVLDSCPADSSSMILYGFPFASCRNFSIEYPTVSLSLLEYSVLYKTRVDRVQLSS